MEIKVLFELSRDMVPSIAEIKFDKYYIQPLPTNSKDLKDGRIRYLLIFNDEIKDGEFGSQPFIEAQMILSILSLLLRSKLEIDSIMINNIKSDMPDPRTATFYSEYNNTINELTDINTFFNKFKSLDLDIIEQFQRACEVYSVALNMIGINNTLSFFLLCTSIECLSNIIYKDIEGSCERFIKFILENLSDQSVFSTEQEWKDILKEIYYNHRSGFTHGGKRIPDSVIIADKFNRVYVKNIIDGKETRTPSLKWFESIVYNCLFNFIDNIKTDSKERPNPLKDLSMKYGIVKVKFKKSAKRGEAVFEKDLDLD